MAPEDLWRSVSRARRELADRIEALAPEQWDADSWCTGWRVRDVLGHLVSTAEASTMSIAWMVVRSGLRADRAMDVAARRASADSVPDLASRLRAVADARHNTSPALGIGDILVHSCDVLAPLGQDDIAMVPAELIAILDRYVRSGRMLFHIRPTKGRHLVATDIDWAYGEGAEVRGSARDLMLLLANRRQILPLLEGPGTDGL